MIPSRPRCRYVYIAFPLVYNCKLFTILQLEETVANHKAKLKVYKSLSYPIEYLCIYTVYISIQSRCSDLNTIVTSLHTLLVSTLPHLYGTQPPLSCNNWSKLISSTQSFISAIAEHTKTTSAKVSHKWLPH